MYENLAGVGDLKQYEVSEEIESKIGGRSSSEALILFDDIESEIDSELSDLIDNRPDWRVSACCASCCCAVLVLVILIYLWPYCLGEVQKTWIAYLNSPPPLVQNSSRELVVRADVVAKELADSGVMVPPSLDIVCSGGGMLSMYCIGAHSVLKGLEYLNRTNIVRLAGASGGGDFAFRSTLYSDRSTAIEQNLALAQVEAEHPGAFVSLVSAITVDDLWRTMGHWIVDNSSNELTRLSDAAFLSVTVLTPWPQNVLVHRYPSPKLAYEAFVSTGSCFLLPSAVSRMEFYYDGKLALDGGALDCEPHFHDGARLQLVIRLNDVEVENKEQIVLGTYTLEEAVGLMQKGQDDIAALLRSRGSLAIVGAMPSDKVPAMRIIDERANSDAIDCSGNAMSEGAIVAIQVGFILSVVFCIVCLPWCWYFVCKRCCRHLE